MGRILARAMVQITPCPPIAQAAPLAVPRLTGIAARAALVQSGGLKGGLWRWGGDDG
ncbi:hypothetical protein [Paracoccus nototheniae]|uniref:hypothetical protein n=1 Tax=Paracoccus nototheniae TaxID=2489002 RepID=UPI0039E914C0